MLWISAARQWNKEGEGEERENVYKLFLHIKIRSGFQRMDLYEIVLYCDAHTRSNVMSIFFKTTPYTDDFTLSLITL